MSTEHLGLGRMSEATTGGLPQARCVLELALSNPVLPQKHAVSGLELDAHPLRHADVGRRGWDR